MSYDLTLFRVPDGTEPSFAYRQIVDQQEIESADLDAWMKRPVPDSQRAEMERLASALESWRPARERFQPTSPLPWIELNDEDLQLQFEVYEAMVSITMPYFRDRAEEMMKCATDSFDVVKSAAGYVAYDPQLGRIVKPTDLSELVAQYKNMDRALPEILDQSRESLSGKKKPWWRLW